MGLGLSVEIGGARVKCSKEGLGWEERLGLGVGGGVRVKCKRGGGGGARIKCRKKRG